MPRDSERAAWRRPPARSWSARGSQSFRIEALARAWRADRMARVNEAPHALRTRFKKTWDVAPLLLVATGTLALGLTLPILDVEKFIFWESNYSVITGVANLFEANEYVLGFIVLLFSIVFPIGKLGVLASLWWGKLTHEQRFTLLRRLETAGRWSMLDVFAVAILVVAGKLGMVADVRARIGIYLFAAAILMSMLATWRVKRLTLKAAREVADGAGPARELGAVQSDSTS